MRTGLILFVSSAVFATTIAVVYWFLSHEPAGTLLLGFMAAAMLVIAIYMVFAELDSNLWGDKEKATFSDAAGEHVATYVTRSPLPFAIGVLVTGILLGLVVSPAAAGIGIAAFLVAIGLMIVSSR